MKIIYLDQNHWIGMARAYYGRSTEWREELDHAVRLVDSDKAVFPVGFANIIETRKIKDSDRRRRLAKFFVHLGKGWFLAPWTSFVDTECLNAVIEVYGLEKERIRISPVGRGIFFAGDTYHQAQEEFGLSYSEVLELEREIDTSEVLIDYLSGENIESPETIVKLLRSQDKRYSEAVDSLRFLRKKEVPHELSDYRAMDVFLSIYTHVLGAHLRLGISQEDLLARGRENMLQLVSAMPTAYTDWQLGYQRDLQRSRQTAPNDLSDLFHLSTAIPYCDLIITEKFWANLASRTDLAERYASQITSNLSTILEIS